MTFGDELSVTQYDTNYFGKMSILTKVMDFAD